ncbi:hypothetical protein LZL87_014057 [Fusarium oxysporum]|nr:hypothetical protein LZL87_014057 [Fusarium oxysporum]
MRIPRDPTSPNDCAVLSIMVLPYRVFIRGGIEASLVSCSRHTPATSNELLKPIRGRKTRLWASSDTFKQLPKIRRLKFKIKHEGQKARITSAPSKTSLMEALNSGLERLLNRGDVPRILNDAGDALCLSKANYNWLATMEENIELSLFDQVVIHLMAARSPELAAGDGCYTITNLNLNYNKAVGNYNLIQSVGNSVVGRMAPLSCVLRGLEGALGFEWWEQRGIGLECGYAVDEDGVDKKKTIKF